MDDINYRIRPTSNSDSEFVAEVSLADVKAHLRVSWSSEDNLITNLLRSAYNIAEGYTGLSLIAKDYKMFLDRFPNSYEGSNEDEWIELKHSCGYLNVETVKYYNSDNVFTTWSANDYNNDTPGLTWARLYPIIDTVFPSTADRPQAVEVLYNTGFKNSSTSTQCPDAIRSAILILVADLYENRQDEIVGRIASELPMTAKHLLDPYRMINV